MSSDYWCNFTAVQDFSYIIDEYTVRKVGHFDNPLETVFLIPWYTYTLKFISVNPFSYNFLSSFPWIGIVVMRLVKYMHIKYQIKYSWISKEWIEWTNRETHTHKIIDFNVSDWSLFCNLFKNSFPCFYFQYLLFYTHTHIHTTTCVCVILS